MTGGGGTDPTKNGPNTHIIVGRGILIPPMLQIPPILPTPLF